EVEAVGVLVEVVEVLVLDRRLLDLVGGLVALRNLHAVADSAHFDLAHRRSLAGMDIFRGQNHVKLAVLLDDVALANRTGDDSQSCFPGCWAPGRSRHGCPLGRQGRFGLQHTDLPSRCQPFAGCSDRLLSGWMAVSRVYSGFARVAAGLAGGVRSEPRNPFGSREKLARWTHRRRADFDLANGQYRHLSTRSEE